MRLRTTIVQSLATMVPMHNQTQVSLQCKLEDLNVCMADQLGFNGAL